MFIKIKKYFLLIPTLCVMLFNCFCIGHVLAADNIIDYSVFFLEPPQDIIDCMDFTDVENIDLFDFPDYSSFYYQVQCDSSDYKRYLEGTIDYLPIDFLIVDFSDSDSFVTVDPTTFSTTPLSYQFFSYYYYRDSGFQFNHDYSDSPRYFYFQPLVGHWGSNSSAFSPDEWDLGFPLSHTLYIECDYFDLNSSSSSSLNVDVAFKPTLSGEVDRSFTRDGVEYLSTNFSLHVNNKSKFPIQYTMDIRPVDSYTDFVFRYYENDWVYAPKLDSAGDFWNQVPQKQQKSTNCHYVSSGSLDSVVFNYNQVNLVEGIEYVVEVYAARNDYGCASELVVSSVEEVYPELYQVQNTLVYQSQFSMKQYSDVKYDPTNTSNGVLPYDFELGQKYEHSYNAVEKEDGVVDYTGKDVYSDKDSWYHKPIDDNTQGGFSSSSTASSNGFSNFAKSFQNFFGFIRYMFNFFPKDAKTIFTIGFSAITIIALVKVLFKS